MNSLEKTTKQQIRGWGTILDYQEKVPAQYAGKSFFEAWHDEIDSFKKLTDEEKWKMGYWIEHQAYKKAGRTGLILGIIIGALITLVTLILII